VHVNIVELFHFFTGIHGKHSMNFSLGLNVSVLTNTSNKGVPSCFNTQESGGDSRSSPHIYLFYVIFLPEET